MNRNIVFTAIVLIAAATAYSFLSLDGTAGRDETGPDNVQSGQARSPMHAEPGPARTAEQKRREAMRAEYDRLEQARDGVRQQLGILKSRLWKLRVPPDRSRAIQEQMRQGYTLLKNPPLLGAFSSADEIAGETEKVNGVNDRLKTLETDIDGYLAARKSR
jgi:hypothetical protein